MKSFFKKIGDKLALMLSGIISIVLLVLSGIGLYFLTRKIDKKDLQLDKTIIKDGDLTKKTSKLASEIIDLREKREEIVEKRDKIKVDSDWHKEKK